MNLVVKSPTVETKERPCQADELITRRSLHLHITVMLFFLSIQSICFLTVSICFY